jgi:ABC-type multidrug transport system fused ATPase/permease subunit
MIKLIFNLLFQYKLYFFYLVFIIFIEGLVNMASILSLIPFTEFILNQDLSEPSKITSKIIKIYSWFNISVTFWSLGSIFVFFNFLKVINFIFIKYAVLKIKYHITQDLYSRLVKNFLNADWLFFLKLDRGKFLNTLTKEMDIVGNSLGNITTQIANTLQLFFYLIVPLSINFYFTSSILLSILLCAIPFTFLSKVSYKYGKKNLDSANIMINSLNGILQGAKVILGYGKEASSLQKYKDNFHNHINFTIKSQMISNAYPQFFVPLSILCVVVSTGFFFKNVQEISELTAIMWSLIAIIPLLIGIIKARVSLNVFLPSYEQLMNLDQEARNSIAQNGNNQIKNFNEKIELKNINFEYLKDNLILRNINLVIKKNEIISIIGKSGSGKSTIVDLIMKLNSPSSGEIFIDEKNLKDLNNKHYKSLIGYVPQDPFLFDTTIRNNLIWANQNATEKEIWDALEKANAKKFINNLPNKIDTLVGDRGVSISGGERQRIVLARAFIKKPDILILDEATNSLDLESENLIYQSIKNLSKKMTIIIITHRLSFLKESDKIYIIEKGQLTESGNYINLINKKDSAISKMIENNILKD